MPNLNINFLPTSRPEMDKLGWDELDILLVSGDAYIDHPSFGVPLLGRHLLSYGYKVGIISQPNWKSPDDIKKMGRPRLFVGISSGALDSMLAHYTAFRKKRHDDAYTPGGKSRARPNRAVVVYTNLVRQAFPKIKIAIGGIEASLRRAVHYDFWTDSIRQSILFDSKADILIYGMGERAIVELADKLEKKESICNIRGTAFIAKKDMDLDLSEAKELPSLNDIKEDKQKLIIATVEIENQIQNINCILVQSHNGRKLIINPKAKALTEKELDKLYSLPFSRNPHPSYQEKIPALEMIRFSITAHRGCGGGCTFCSLALHQGKNIASRSEQSIINEIKSLLKHKAFKGSISDIGGPTANSYQSRCKINGENCHRKSCYAPAVCQNLELNHDKYLQLLSHVNDINGIKHLRVASGIRYDLVNPTEPAILEITKNFTGGQLKLAPEHCSENVLKKMRKTKFEKFEKFIEIFYNKTNPKKTDSHSSLFVIPYLMSAFPGCTMADMQELSSWLRKKGWKPQQVQCFIPTPGTVATAMFYAEKDENGNDIYVAKTDKERLEQHRTISP